MAKTGVDFRNDSEEKDNAEYAKWKKKVADGNRASHKKRQALKKATAADKPVDVPPIISNPHGIADNINAVILSLAEVMTEAKQLDATGQWKVSDRVSQKVRTALDALDIIKRDITKRRNEIKSRVTSTNGKGKGSGAKALGELDEKIVDSNDFDVNR